MQVPVSTLNKTPALKTIKKTNESYNADSQAKKLPSTVGMFDFPYLKEEEAYSSKEKAQSYAPRKPAGTIKKPYSGAIIQRPGYPARSEYRW